VLAIFLNGDTDFFMDPFGEPVRDSSFFLVINAHYENVTVTLPDIYGQKWIKEFDTGEGWCDAAENFGAGDTLDVVARSCWLLRNAS
jgi:glycogen operon protein